MRKLILAGFTIAILLLAPGFSQAQSRRTVKDSSVTIIFNESNANPKSNRSSGENNIVKILPLGFISGSFPLLYERRINDFLTIEAGGGLTSRNYMRGAFVQVRDMDEQSMIKEYPWSGTGTSSDYDHADALYTFENRKAELGYMVRVEPRIYFESDAPDGAFLGLQFGRARYNFVIPGLVGDVHKGDPKKEHENVSDFMVNFGTQWIHEKITVESSTGLGLRKVNGVKYVSNGSVEGFAPYEQQSLNFNLTFKIGYHF